MKKKIIFFIIILSGLIGNFVFADSFDFSSSIDNYNGTIGQGNIYPSEDNPDEPFDDRCSNLLECEQRKTSLEYGEYSPSGGFYTDFSRDAESEGGLYHIARFVGEWDTSSLYNKKIISAKIISSRTNWNYIQCGNIPDENSPRKNDTTIIVPLSSIHPIDNNTFGEFLTDEKLSESVTYDEADNIYFYDDKEYDFILNSDGLSKINLSGMTMFGFMNSQDFISTSSLSFYDCGGNGNFANFSMYSPIILHVETAESTSSTSSTINPSIEIATKMIGIGAIVSVVYSWFTIFLIF